MTESLANVCKALAAAQGKLRKAVKDSTNPHFRSRYADLESVIEAMREPFASEGLSVVQSVWDGMLRTTIFHSSGESISSTVPLFIPKQDMQGVGSAITYARRYGLAAACGISQTDDDGNDACPAPKPVTKAQQQAKDLDAWSEKSRSIARSESQSTSEISRCMSEMEAAKKTEAAKPAPESTDPYEYPKHRDLVVAAAKELGISAPRITANRDQLNEFLYTNAYGNLTSIKQAMGTFFSKDAK